MADPLNERIAELTELVRTGRATDAEREELELYANDSDESQAIVAVAKRDEELGGEWLARSVADNKLAAAEKTPLARAERGLGVAMVIGGVAGSFLFPPAIAVAALGAGLLTFSVVRVKIKTAGQDPYSKIEK